MKVHAHLELPPGSHYQSHTLSRTFKVSRRLLTKVEVLTTQGINAFFTAWYTAVSAAPNNVDSIVSTLDPDPSPMEAAALSADYQTLVQGVQTKISDTLTNVLGNATQFVAFINQGKFTVPNIPDGNTLTSFLSDAFNTYLISQSLSQGGISVTVGVDTDPVDLSTNGTEFDLPYMLGDCGGGRNAQGVCDAWWYSDTYNSSFALQSANASSTNYGDTITRLLASNLTTGKLLFDSPYACTLNGVVGGAANVKIDAAGVNTFCINNFVPLVWDKQCHASPSDDPGSNCEFVGVEKQGPFWFDEGDGQHFVPYSYLGPAIAQEGSGITRS